MCALTDNQISNYWVSSGKYDSIFTYIRYNIDEIQDNLTLMFAVGGIPSGICSNFVGAKVKRLDKIRNSHIIINDN